MGNNQSLQLQIAIYQPPPNQLVLIDPGINFRIYQHRLKMFEVMAHKFTLNSQDDLQIMVENFIARYQHHYLVSTMYLKCEDYSTCGGYIEAIVFYQRIFTNLSKIKDIPLNDALHFYAVAFKGFQILYRRFGYFQIYEDMFFLAQDSKLKVWCNKDISKNQPQEYLLDKTGKQQDMIRKIIFIVGQNTDPLTDKIQLKQRLFSNGVRNFEMALQSLREICRHFGLSVPERVQCMIGLPSQQVRSVLDQYATNMRRVFNQVSNQTYSGYMMASGRSNNIMVSSGNTINTPHFVSTPNMQGSPAPSIQQFMLSNPPQNISTQIITSSNSLISPTPLPPSPMLQTFNKYQQSVSNENKRGIDLSLSTKKDRPPSAYLNKSQSAMLSGRNNKSVENKYKNMVSPPMVNNINYSNNKGIRKDSSVIHKNGLLNTQVQHGVYHNNTNSSQMKSYYPQQVTLGQQFNKPTLQVRPNYHFQPNTTNYYPPKQHQIHINSSIVNPYLPQQTKIQTPIVIDNSKIYHSQPKPSQNISTYPVRKPSILKRQSSIMMKNSNNNLQKTQSLKKSNIIHVNFVNNNNNQGLNLNGSPSQPIYRPSEKIQQSPINLNNPLRQRRVSSKSKNNYQQQKKIDNKFTGRKDQHQEKKMTSSIDNIMSTSRNGTLKRDASTPILGKGKNNDKVKSNPFELVQNSQVQNFNISKNYPPHPPPSIPLSSPSASPFFAANSTSSRYLYSNKQLNDNIPDLKYFKKQSPKKTINKLFDTKIQQLQSFNESRFGTINSLKEMNNQNSQVIEIIGREKKDSITSAFDQQEKWGQYDGVKQKKYQNNNDILKFDNVYKNSDSFTDPKILQILKRPSSKALKNELNSLKKTSKGSKMYQFSRETPLRNPQIDRQVKQDMFAFPRESQKTSQFYMNGQNNFTSNISRQDFQGFPSLSNLSQINKLQQNTQFNDQRSSPIFNNSNTKQQSNVKKSRFSQQNGVSKLSSLSKKQQPVAISEFYNKYDFSNNNNDGPTYQYSFSSKKQIPIQDNQWRTKYATTTSNKKQDLTIMNSRSGQFKVVPQRQNGFLQRFNSNESLASLEFELSKKLTPIQGTYDGIKQQELIKNDNNIKDDEFYRVRVSSAEKQTVSNRKYKPALDPQIGRDLEMFRKKRNQINYN